MELTAVPEHANFPGDLALTDREGLVVFIDVKVRSHSPKSRDLNAGYEKIRFSQEQGRNLEVWHFNTERLNLLIQSYDRGMPIHCEIAPVDVWETTDSGIFRRDQVVAEVARWEKNVKELYEVIINWYNGIANVTFELSRTVCMSEEMMQKYAVSDRELPILDILSEGHVLASFVPRGLWLIGAWGRIDIITPTQTRMLVMLRVENQSLQWHIVSHDNRRETKLLTRELMQQLLEVR
jgi:Holliday junction resolvase-like predicted endonuclease